MGSPWELRARNYHGFARNFDPNLMGPVRDLQISEISKCQKGLESIKKKNVVLPVGLPASRIFFNFDFAAFIKALFIFSVVKFFDEENTNSTKETFGVGTLIEIPSTLPFKSGITSPRDFVAPVVVGIIEFVALLALLKSLCELSNNL